MTRKIFLLATLFLCFVLSSSYAQDNSLKLTAKPKDMWEFGVHVGHLFTAGDLDYKPGFGAGIHFRKSTDYLFSVRFDAMYGVSNGDEDIVRPDGISEHTTNWGSATLQGLITFNNFKAGSGEKKERKTNVYALAGVGLTYFKTEVVERGTTKDAFRSGPDDDKIKPLAEGGVGMSFRVSDKFNVGIEHKLQANFGNRADYVDGVAFAGGLPTTESDLQNYTSIRLNFNLGNTEELSQPLYWVSPLQLIAEDLAEVKARPKLDLTDSDGDGVIDMLDQEKDSPQGAPVDTRGIILDSDGDGVPDYNDKEPYSQPGYDVDEVGVAQVPPPNVINEEDVNRIFDERFNQVKGTLGGVSSVDWFLPMINFANNSYQIRPSEFAKLKNVATVMKQHPGIRIVATGHTDKTAGNCTNEKLSYNRAQAAIDYLANKYGIDKERFVLNYQGENDNLVPTNGRSLMNRRVEFKVADIETAMDPPNCTDGAGGDGTKYSGNKESGF